MKTKNKKKMKIIITQNMSKHLKAKDNIEVSFGYAKYLLAIKKAVPYSEYYANKIITSGKLDDHHQTDLSLLVNYINNMCLNVIRISNKSYTLYNKVTRDDVMKLIIDNLQEKNISSKLIDILKKLKPISLLAAPDIKTANLVYSIKLIGDLEGATVHLCVAGTKEQCELLAAGVKL